MKLYGHPVSTCTRKVLMTLVETGTPFELAVVDFAKGEHKQPPHTTRQPFGQVPALEDDGFEMYESRAMARYINRKANGNLEPSDLQGRARMEQWISIEGANFSPHAMKFVYHHVFKRPQEEAVLELAAQKVDLATQVLDARLAQSQYLAGPEFSLADVCYLPYFEYITGSPAKDLLLKRPAVADWWQRVRPCALHGHTPRCRHQRML